jgi:eukaryotic-like serine/threonine-protein kinase
MVPLESVGSGDHDRTMTIPGTTGPAEEENAAFAQGVTVANKYVVERTLGSGGLGVVVVARHLELDQRVAIKYLKAEARRNPSFVERFRREARLTAQIRSEHVVRVHDVGESEATGPYLVMEYLEGKDLGHAIEDGGGQPTVRAVDYLLQACDALAEAHALGIVHRDLKPENLFLAQRPNQSPILKIIDFGVSKMTPKQGDGSWSRMTSDNERFGTPVYMSPEQLRSAAAVDCRADLWALGVILFELVSGKLPFDGEDVPQLCTSILMGEPAKLSAMRPNIPHGFEAVISKCLQKEPRFRFRNVAELAQELAPFGPPDADQRVRRIKSTVVQSGLSIRPPTPLTISGPELLLANLDAHKLHSRDALTVELPRRSTSRIGAWVGAGVAGATFLGFAAWFFAHGVTTDPAVTVTVAPTPPPAPAPKPPPAPVPVPVPPPVTIETTPPATANGAASPHSTSRPAAGSAAQRVPPPAVSANPGVDRRALYGDRN